MDATLAVVGGTYREQCEEPRVQRLCGSGLRATQILHGLGHQVRFVTCIDDHLRAEFDALTAALPEVHVEAIFRSGPIGFTYETPVHPTYRGGTATADPLTATADVVVAFGMVEKTDWTVEATWAVVDPQHAPLRDILGRVTAEHRAVVLNEHEIRTQANDDDLDAAAQYVLGLGVDVVVVKQGARGGLVVSSVGTGTFGACPTERVDPIGSGDAFTAGFAHAWATQKQAPEVAALFASQVAAAHSLTGVAGFSAAALTAVPDPIAYVPGPGPRVYLAGPFFNIAQRQLITLIRSALTQLGVEVFSPLHEIGRGGDEVAQQDLAGLRDSSSVLAVLDGADAGTLFEVGWATGAGIPVVGLAEQHRDHAWTMVRGTGSPVVPDLSTAVYRAAWAALSNARRP
ncbi:PfkB family carbohydrate kinase [Cellulomonas cellasea]|uniref:Nucleoside 2-deoxyribosyltransferase n=1 Tax=Cellulomonas cellasea TaxID=43670 RepID=A0A7W4UH79_9CELL|nr:PfkB family carbohydrate kinase [Cellulomonas cellasea]MBB2924118.1 nucleoside 2-deoxyribosyltransferase [Cellulomonas cellasea]